MTFEAEAWNMQGAGRAAAEAPGLEAGRVQEAAEAALAAAEVDPEGILTGKQALKAANELDEEARAIQIDLENGVGEIVGGGEDAETLADRALEIGEENDEKYAAMLRACGSKVGKGKWITYGSGIFAEKFWQSAVCYYHFSYAEAYGRFLIGRTEVVEMCWDNPRIGDEAW